MRKISNVQIQAFSATHCADGLSRIQPQIRKDIPLCTLWDPDCCGSSYTILAALWPIAFLTGEFVRSTGDLSSEAFSTVNIWI